MRLGCKMLTMRPASEADRSFVYDLFKANMKSYFDRHLPEKWSDEKFHRGYNPSRTTILEAKGKPVGFVDVEPRPEFLYVYVHNVQLHPTHHGGNFRQIASLLEDIARKYQCPALRGKVFRDNTHARGLLAHLGYEDIQDITAEFSVGMEKRLSLCEEPSLI